MNKTMDMWTHGRIKALQIGLRDTRRALEECASMIEDNYELMDYASVPAVATQARAQMALAALLLDGRVEL